MSLEHPNGFRLRVTVATVLALCLATVACESEAQKGAKAKAMADQKAYQEKYVKAKALFEERCKTAGVVIHRTVKDVEGIELTKVREPVPWGGKQYFEPMWAEAAMAGESRGDSYINQFLMDESVDRANPNQRGRLNPPGFDAGEMAIRRLGYRYVELIAPASGMRFKAKFGAQPAGKNHGGVPPRLTPIDVSSTRYALDYEDILNPEDRVYWVAGTVLRVIDKQNGEVVAQLTKYVWDPGFGVSTTGRWPWQHADGRGDRNCPYMPFQPTGHDSRYFVDTVLIPKQGD